jgi:hypothetical protein
LVVLSHRLNSTVAAAGRLVAGGQYCAQTPVQFDRDGVSGANQYRVRPLALVSTVAPLMVAVFSVAVACGAADALPAPATATPSSTKAVAEHRRAGRVAGRQQALAELVEAAARSGMDDAATKALGRLSKITAAAGTEWGLGVEARCRALLRQGDAAERL